MNFPSPRGFCSLGWKRVTARYTSGEKKMTVGKRLRRLRQSAGLTQRELALPRYTHAYVSTIEAGRRTPSRAAIEYFADKLSVGVDELLTGRPPDLMARLEFEIQDARR